MALVADRPRAWGIHPFHAVALAGAFPLFLGALLCDWAYYNQHQIQWSNFASWLLIGAMVMLSIALLCAIIGFFRGTRWPLYLLVLAATWLVGLFDALHHGRDAWAIMPTALVLSLLATVLALVATWLGFASVRAGEVR